MEKLPADKLKLVFSTWADNLTSGEFAQTKHNLRKTDGSMCCLGVLCETMIRMGLLDARWEAADRGMALPLDVLVIDDEDQFLPARVQLMTGLDQDGQIVGWVWEHDGDERDTLTGANDDGNWNFREIGQAVREYIEKELS